MTILKDILSELVGMFLGDAHLSVAILIVVALTAGAINLAGASPLLGGVVLLAGCLAVLIGAVVRTARQRTKAAKVSNAGA